MVPKYPFIVRIYRKVGTGEHTTRDRLDHSYESHGAACVRFQEAMKDPRCTSAQILCVLDELHKNGDILIVR